ncbi:MAG: SAM hydroxide adenosyltransferase [Opitutales bacterium]
MHPRFVRLRISAWLLPLVGAASLLADGPVVTQGALEGVPYFIAEGAPEPTGWLLYAHGFRPEDYALSAALPIEEEPWRTWLEEGWTILATAFRRNGWIVSDAGEDLLALERWWEDQRARPGLVVLWGESMGAAVVTQIAEESEQPGRYTGAVGVSPALFHPEILARVGDWSFAPQIPLLFASNQNEMADPEHYAERADGRNVGKVAVWKIARDGHVNLTAAENHALLEAIEGWGAGTPPDLRRDATLAAERFASRAVWDGTTALVPVTRIDPDFGNVDLALTVEDLDRLGVAAGELLEVVSGEVKVRALRGATYGDVSRGEWLAVILANGQVRLAINYGDAAVALGVAAPGQTVQVRAAK